MYTVAPWSKFTASFVVIRIVFEVQISSQNMYCEFTLVHVYDEKYSC